MNWIDAAAMEDLWDGAGLGVTVQGREVALFRIGDAVFATDAFCTHGQARLCEGFIEGHEVECPLHQGRFDLRSGAATCAPATQALKTLPVRIDGGRVWLAIDAGGAKVSELSFSEFESAARARGFTEVLERQWAAGTVIDTHTHAFAVEARVVQGEMWLTVGDTTRHLQPGDGFTLDREVPHAERYGGEGATFWVARRNAAP